MTIFPLLQGEVLLRFVQSKEEQERILHACHVDATAGHMGKTRTICRIKERFMWHGIVKDVKELVSVVDNITPCTTCAHAVVKSAPCNYFCNANDVLSYCIVILTDFQVQCMPTYEPEAYNWHSTTASCPSESTLASARH